MTEYTIFVAMSKNDIVHFADQEADTPQQAVDQVTDDVSAMDIADLFGYTDVPQDFKFLVVAESNLVTVESDIPTGEGLHARVKEIIEKHDEGDGTKTDIIYEEMDVNESTTTKVMNDLIQQGEIWENKPGYYRVL